MKDQQHLTRRGFLTSAAFLGAGLALAACTPAATAPSAAQATAPAQAAGGATAAPAAAPNLPFTVAPEAMNPLNVKSGEPVDGVFFEGGYGRGYIDHAADLFRALHPDNKMSVSGIQRVGEQLRPRFIGGNPPDVIDNSGAGNLDTAALVANNQLADLAPLMQAPSLDTPGKTFAETLFPGSQTDGVYDGKQLVLFIAYTVYGIWNSKPLLDQKGWKYPTTWSGMLDLCETIKTAGMNPWTYQGKYPQYMVSGVLIPLIYKIGGIQPIVDIDNLEDGAWQKPEVLKAVTLMGELAKNNYIMPGTSGLTHTESQAEWLKGNAVFIPCGTWLENEMKTLTPKGFDMVVHPVPTVDGGKGSADAIYATSGENYFVPAQAKNVAAGMEYLRCLLSKDSAKYFAQNVSSIMPVTGGTEGVEISTGMQTALADVKNAGDQIFTYLYPTWYVTLMNETRDRTGDLLTNRITPEQFVEAVQKQADAVKADSTIKKYHRSA